MRLCDRRRFHCGHGCLSGKAFLTVAEQARDKLALPNALNLLFGELLLVCATLSIRALENDLLEPFGAFDRYALRFGSLFSLMKIDVRLNGMVLKHSNCTFYKKVPKIHEKCEVPKT